MGTVTARISEETSSRLEELAAFTKRSKSFLVADALELYLNTNAWQVARTQESIAQADQGRFASPKQVGDSFRDMGLKVE